MYKSGNLQQLLEAFDNLTERDRAAVGEEIKRLALEHLGSNGNGSVIRRAISQYFKLPRRQPRASVSGKRSRAVVTLVRNESEFLPVWLRYYSQFFASQDIYVLDHETSDGSTDGPGFVRIPVCHSTVDVAWNTNILQSLQHCLLDSYELVICAHVDEIIAPDPRVGTLGDYIERFQGDFVNCRGYEVLHIKDQEPPLDLRHPIFEQRFIWYFNPMYSKPLLARVPMSWQPGMHERADGRRREDANLYLIHLHRVDYDLCLERHRRRVLKASNERDIDLHWGYQNRITEGVEFERWFYHDSSCPEVGINPEPIPPYWRSLI